MAEADELERELVVQDMAEAPDGRPISQAKGVYALAKERGPLYEKWADLTLACTGSAAGDAEEVLKILRLKD